MLMISATTRAAPIGRATKKSIRLQMSCTYVGLPFRASVLIFECVTKKKTGLFGCREDLFLVFIDFGCTRAIS